MGCEAGGVEVVKGLVRYQSEERWSAAQVRGFLSYHGYGGVLGLLEFA